MELGNTRVGRLEEVLGKGLEWSGNARSERERELVETAAMSGGGGACSHEEEGRGA
jgi:hypothetical protein